MVHLAAALGRVVLATTPGLRPRPLVRTVRLVSRTHVMSFTVIHLASTLGGVVLAPRAGLGAAVFHGTSFGHFCYIILWQYFIFYLGFSKNKNNLKTNNLTK